MGNLKEFINEIANGLGASLDEGIRVVNKYLNAVSHNNSDQQNQIVYAVAALFEKDTPLARELVEKLIIEHGFPFEDFVHLRMHPKVSKFLIYNYTIAHIDNNHKDGIKSLIELLRTKKNVQLLRNKDILIHAYGFQEYSQILSSVKSLINALNIVSKSNLSMPELGKNEVICCLDKFLVHEVPHVSDNKRPNVEQTPVESTPETAAPPTKKHKIASDTQATANTVLLSQLPPKIAQETIRLQQQTLLTNHLKK